MERAPRGDSGDEIRKEEEGRGKMKEAREEKW